MKHIVLKTLLGGVMFGALVGAALAPSPVQAETVRSQTWTQTSRQTSAAPVYAPANVGSTTVQTTSRVDDQGNYSAQQYRTQEYRGYQSPVRIYSAHNDEDMRSRTHYNSFTSTRHQTRIEGPQTSYVREQHYNAYGAPQDINPAAAPYITAKVFAAMFMATYPHQRA